MWARNLLFVGLLFFGAASVAGGLLSGNRLQPPADSTTQLQQDDLQQIVEKVNSEFRKKWASENLEFGERADTLTLARRLSLGLTGTIPSLEELRLLEQQSPENQAQFWVNHLLEDRRFADHVAERLTRAYVGTENGPFLVFRRRRFASWLSDRLAENYPYDEIVTKLLTDRGLWTSSPAVNFMTVTLTEDNEGRPDPIRLAGRTSRAFLGMRIDCLQCHDDRLGNVELGDVGSPRGGLQSDFHQLAAFFSETRVSPLGVVDDDKEYKYRYLNAEEEEVVSPLAPFQAELMTDEGNRRERLAAWVTSSANKPFARATVNRIWALMFGKSLVEPVDDIPLHGEFPPGLESLAEDFVQHGCDLHRLIRVIASTDVYQVDSRADFKVTDVHEQAWAVFPLTRLRPEQVAGGLLQACSLKTIDANSHIVFQIARFQAQNEFVKRFGDTGEDEFDERAGTIPQRLLLMNGNLVKERTKQDLNNAASRIAQMAPDDQKAVETAFLTVLSRRPSPKELAHFSLALDGKKGDARAAPLEDLYWVLLNSTEFSWNH